MDMHQIKIQIIYPKIYGVRQNDVLTEYILPTTDTILDLQCKIAMNHKHNILSILLSIGDPKVNKYQDYMDHNDKVTKYNKLYVQFIDKLKAYHIFRCIPSECTKGDEDKPLCNNNITHMTKEKLDYIEQKYNYKSNPISVERQIYFVDDSGSMHAYHHWLDDKKNPDYKDNGYLMMSEITEKNYKVNPSHTFSDLEKQIKEDIVESQIVMSVDQIEITNLYVSDYSRLWYCGSHAKNLYKQTNKDQLIINGIVDNGCIVINVKIKKDNFIKIFYEIEKSIFMDKRLPVRDLCPTVNPNCLVIYHKNKILDCAMIIGEVIQSDDIIKIVVLPAISYELKCDHTSLYNKRDYVYDFTINLLKGKVIISSHKMLMAMFIFQTNLDPDNFFLLLLRNQDKYVDTRNEINIDITSLPFNLHSLEQNDTAIKFLIDYAYHNTSSYKMLDVVANMQCISLWADYMGMDAIKTILEDESIVECYSKLQNITNINHIIL